MMLKFAVMSAALLLATTGLASASPSPTVSLYRLDCGTGLVKDFNSFFSDTGDYKPGPREITDSCYLIRHQNHYLLWDTGFPAALKGKSTDIGPIVARMDRTVPEQLAVLGLKPADITVVGISHMHADHTGQAKDFAGAKLVIGKADFEQTAGKGDPFGPWRKPGARLELMHGGDLDIFGDGRVVALNLPGHTPDHMALKVRLDSGYVLLTGDLYHAGEARIMRGVPPFNTSRAETMASFDRFERIAKNLKARVIIQHEPGDIAKLPAFPKPAQ
jgi:glyoxylase-like metal-dependent hydrolase (beta-lactamase superfamily II)